MVIVNMGGDGGGGDVVAVLLLPNQSEPGISKN